MKHINLQTTITLLLLSMLPLLASGFRVNGICYYINSDGTSVTVTYERTSSPRYNNLSGSLTIPESVTYNGTTYSVTGIGYRAFESCSGLTSVTIGNSVTYISDNAFESCSGLTSVTIGNSVTYISDNAFRYCSGLTSVTIPNSVTSIGYDAFSDCSGLTSVTIGNSVTSIGDNAFRYCYGLTSVTIGNSVTSIGDDAFWDCSGISELTWNAKNCSSRGSMPTSKIETLTIGNEVESLPSHLASESKITSVTIPNSVTSIGEWAFKGCSGLTGELVIPNSVTSIGIGAFWGCSGLTGELVIPNSVTSIGGSAFSGCSGLTSVTIPNSVTSIGDWAFKGCSGLTSVTIPNSVTSIGSSAFSGCSGLTSVTIPNSVISIGSYAFLGCSGLTSVTIGNSVTSIASSAFQGCSGLTQVVWNAKNCGDFSRDYPPFHSSMDYSITNFIFGDSVQRIPSYLCYGMTKLTSIAIPNSVTSIGSGAFYDCSGLTSVTIPNSVTSIGSSAFSGCSGLTSVTIPNSVTSIGDDAFYKCSCLTSVTIPNSVTSIGKYAFSGCSGLTEVVWNAKNCGFSDSGGPFSSARQSITNFTFGDSVQKIPACICYDFTALKSVTIPNSVTSIGSSAFSGCSGLTSVTIGNSVTSIGSSAFARCSGLTLVVWNAKNCGDFSGDYPPSPFHSSMDYSITNFIFGDSVQRIPSYLCYGMTKLTNIAIPNSVTSIGGVAFDGCSGLTSVTIGNSVTSIGDNAFRGCSGISELTWNAKNCSSRGSMPTSKIETLTIGNEVESLPSSLVSGSKITSVTIPNSVTSIGSSAFSGCYGLTSVTIPNSVTSIGYSAFARCSGLKQVVWNAKNCGDFFWNDHPFDSSMDCSITNFIFGDSVQRIPSSLCYEMTKLTSIAIPNSVTSIGREAFWGCSGLTEVVWNAKNCSDFTSSSNPFSSARQSITYFTFGDSVQKIPAYICYHFTALTSVTIPNSVTSIGYEAFSGCSGLTSVTIGNSVTSIGGGAFDGCSGLTEVTIPNSVTSIGSSAFSGCSGLTKLTSQIVEPQEVFYGSSVFYGVSSSCRVYVPRFTYYQYKKTFPWSRFFIVSDEANLQLNVEMDTLRHTRGEEAQIMDVTLDLSNYVDLTGLQFDVTLPSEITYSNAILENGRSGGDHTIDVARIQFGKYRVLLSSLTNQPINGEDGPLLHFAVTVPRLHGTGYRSISFDNIVLATTDEIAYNIFGFTTGLKLDYIVGDANADALVDAADYVVTARRIMGYSTATYYSDAANVNNDGSVNVTDLVGITNIALGIRPIERRQLPALMPNEQSAVHTAPALSATVQAQPDGNQVLFALGNEWAAAGMQMDVTLPAGVTVLKAELLGRAAGQQVDLATLADGRVRVLVSSFSASDIAAGDDAILALTLDGSQNGMMTVSDIIVAERDLTTHELAPLSVALSTTGVSDLVASAGVRIWAENGSVVIESDEAGMAQLVMLNGMTQPLQVQPGRNTYPVAPGYYIVRLAGHTAKLKL